ncbi:MAG: tyrosine-type recombinase/integrase [Pseudomonadota bacterium]
MATIVERKKKDGSASYLAQIIRRGHGLKESRTFSTRKAAEAWAKMREKEIASDLSEGRSPLSQKAQAVTLGDAIDKYILESKKEIGKTKEQCLRTIRKEYRIADKRCDQITSKDLVAFAQELHNRPGLGSASTAGNYLSHLSAVFKVARVAWGMPLDKRAMEDAMEACKSLGTIAKSGKRDRRPTLAELDAIMQHLADKLAYRPKSGPMHRVTAFAIFSTRRQDEICRITWADYEPDAKRVMVRDMKHPGDRVGNDVWVKLPDPACAIIDAMPKVSDRIFPYTADAVSAAFTRACKALDIRDLHFHDLRHEGASRLFEMGWNIPHVMEVTGHRTWNSLQRYTHLRETGDKFEGWTWVDAVTTPAT